MASPLTGIHHVTALAQEPMRNHAFYTIVLGLRMVKKTVNFDDPLTYHLYYGDEHGSPGTVLTHFPHPFAKPGVHGSPEIRETVLRVPSGAMSFWQHRLTSFDIETTMVDSPNGARLDFADHDDMRFAIIECGRAPGDATKRHDDVDVDRAIIGIDGTVVHIPNIDDTVTFLRDVLEFDLVEQDAHRARLALGTPPASSITLLHVPTDSSTTMGAGTVHHVAWRVPDDETQRDVAQRISSSGIGVTPVMDRQYFRSIYFRIPGGVIFEVATDGPGFDVDEPIESLGASLKLPPQYESRREEIESHLVPLTTD